MLAIMKIGKGATSYEWASMNLGLKLNGFPMAYKENAGAIVPSHLVQKTNALNIKCQEGISSPGLLLVLLVCPRADSLISLVS